MRRINTSWEANFRICFEQRNSGQTGWQNDDHGLFNRCVTLLFRLVICPTLQTQSRSLERLEVTLVHLLQRVTLVGGYSTGIAALLQVIFRGELLLFSASPPESIWLN